VRDGFEIELFKIDPDGESSLGGEI